MSINESLCGYEKFIFTHIIILRDRDKKPTKIVTFPKTSENPASKNNVGMRITLPRVLYTTIFQIL